jgi:acetolactate synthase-1/3 small subunit
MRHTISILVENEAGALSRIAGLFSARGYNIESLTVAPTEDATISRMTLVTRGSDAIIEQIIKQLNKLIDVIKLVDLTEGKHLEREMLLIKLSTETIEESDEVQRLVDIFRGRVIDVCATSYIVELSGHGDKLDAFIAAIKHSKILETVRSGVSGIARGNNSLHV